MPSPLAQRAEAVAADTSVPLGTTESYPLPGVVTLIRIEPRVWGKDPSGNFVQGCFRVGGIYLPSGTPAGAGISAPSDGGSSVNTVVGVLTAASLAVGTAATLAAWGKKQ